MDDENDNNFRQVPLPPMQKRKANKFLAPYSDSNDSSSCEEAVEGPSMRKEGGNKPKLAKKKKAKIMEKGNDLVVTPSSVKLRINSCLFC